MNEIILDAVIKIVVTVVVTVVGALCSLIMSKTAKNTQLANTNAALRQVLEQTEITVLELQQTYVDAWKAESEDGKLSKGQIKELNALLLDQTKAKVSDAALKILAGAGNDITALILGAGEAILQRMRGR